MPCRSSRGFPADSVDSDRELHDDVMTLEPFQSFPLRNEPLGNAVFTIHYPVDRLVTLPSPELSG